MSLIKNRVNSHGIYKKENSAKVRMGISSKLISSTILETRIKTVVNIVSVTFTKTNSSVFVQ
jgi:hypothetical protein